jgi:hypothetical protein
MDSSGLHDTTNPNDTCNNNSNHSEPNRCYISNVKESADCCEWNSFNSAVKYIQNGLSIFAVPKPGWINNDGIEYDGKKPYIKWTEFQNRKAEHKEIETWFLNHEHNIAIVTGKISSVFVIDIDGERSKQVFESQILQTFGRPTKCN